MIGILFDVVDVKLRGLIFIGIHWYLLDVAHFQIITVFLRLLFKNTWLSRLILTIYY